MQCLLFLLPFFLWSYNTCYQFYQYLIRLTGPLVVVRSGDSRRPFLSSIGRTIQYTTGLLPSARRKWLTTIYLPHETITSILLTSELEQDVREIIAGADTKNLPRRKNITLYSSDDQPVIKDLGMIDGYYRHLHRKSVTSLPDVTQALGINCHRVNITVFCPPRVTRDQAFVKTLSVGDLYHDD